MKKAHNKIVKEIKYNLRPNAERARLAAENRQAADAANHNNPTVNSNPCEIKQNKHIMNQSTAVVTQTARFCGHVESSNPDKQRLEQYNVYRWLSDVETRIASLKIQAESDKIKEALLLVSTDFGNAHAALNGAAFQGIKTFKEFKAECVSLWKPAEKADKLANIHKFINTRREGESLVSAYTNITNNMEQVRKDILSLPQFPTSVDDDTQKVTVDLDNVLRYFAFGVLYETCTENERKALKRITLDPTKRLTAAVENVKEEVAKSNVNLQEERTLITITTDSKEREGHRNYRNNRENFRGRGSYRGNFRGSSDVRNRGYNGRINGQEKPLRCSICHYFNHTTSECRWKKKCNYCSIMGHDEKECRRKKHAQAKQSQEKTYTVAEIQNADPSNK